MKVYIVVFWIAYEGDEIIAVYDSEEKAKSYVDAYEKIHGKNKYEGCSYKEYEVL